MSTTTITGQPIAIGYAWRQRLQVVSDTPMFPAGVALRAQLRPKRGGEVVADLSTDAGSLVRIADDQVDVVLSETLTIGLEPGTVSLDLVRTDAPPDRYLYVTLTVPVILPLTAPVTP